MWPKDNTTFKFGNYTFLPLRPMRQSALQQQKQIYLIPDYFLYVKYAACHIIDFFPIFYPWAIKIKTWINPLSCKPTLLPDDLIKILALSGQQQH